VAREATSIRTHIQHPNYWALSLFVIVLMTVTTALPAHMVSLLREAGMTPQWVLVIPASIGVLQVMGRVGLFTLERQLNVHQTNRWVPCLIPLGMVALWLGASSPFSALVFVVLYGLGNGMLTIVKGTVMAQYIESLRALVDGFVVVRNTRLQPRHCGDDWLESCGHWCTVVGAKQCTATRA
jgi:hypothetical protein